MAVVEFYQKVLESAGCSVDDQGLVSIKIGEHSKPMFIDELRLTLPTPAILSNPDWDTICPFHPLSENIVRGESPVLKQIRLIMNARITDVFSDLSMQLMEIAIDIDQHKKLDPKCAAFLKLLPNVNEKTIKVLQKVFCAITLEGDRRLFSIYLKRGGKLKGTNFNRVASVAFPITESIDADDKEIYGVKLSTMEKTAIKNLFYYILPEANDQERYSFGSNNDTAPYFHALCGAYINVIKQLNTVVKLFKKHLDHPEHLKSDISWEDELSNLATYSREIPPLPYNDGVMVNNPKAGATVNEPPRAATNLASQLGNVNIPLHQTGQTVVAPIQMQPQQVTAVPASVINNDGKLDFHAVFDRNPMLGGGMPIAPVYNMPPPVAAGSYAGYDRGQPTYQQPNMGWGQPVNNWGQPVQPVNNGYYQQPNMYQQPMYQTL